MSKKENMNPRTARVPAPGEQQYVIAKGAPMHYVDGYGLCGPGAIVTLAPGVTPGKWMLEVSPEDAAKAGASESEAQRLATLAAATIKARGNEADVKRKKASDDEARKQAEKEAVEAAKREADAIKKADDAAKEAQTEKDRAEQERARADEAERRAKAAEEQLAKLQKEAGGKSGK